MSSGSRTGHPPGLYERAVRMVAAIRHEHASDWAAIESVAIKFGIGTAQTLQLDSQDADQCLGIHPGMNTEIETDMRMLRADDRESKCVNGILVSLASNSLQ